MISRSALRSRGETIELGEVEAALLASGPREAVVMARADAKWSLSPLVLPHMLVRLVVISPGLSVGGRFYDYFPINQERRWLIDTIAAGKAQGRWIVVALHKPCVSVGEKPCEIRADLMDVLTSADLLLAGHDHIYERTQQFRTGPGCTTFSSTWANPACVGGDGYGGTYTAGRGAVQVISGVGGQSQNTLGASDTDWPYVVVANGRNSWSSADGYLRITATPSALAGEFRATRGQFGDSFTIRR